MTTLIIGGGWSGLAAAVTLIQKGHSVHLIESAKQLGGRARNVLWHEQTIDNGQHLMIGAYDRMLAMMNLVGVKEDDAFHRFPMDITIHDTYYSPLNLSANSFFPWPLSLAWNLIRSVGVKGFFSVTKLQSSIPSLLLQEDVTVSEWLLSTSQPARLIKQLWEPLCLATLNTPIDHASAHLMATVLQDSLGKGQAAADALIPSVPLAEVFPHAAAHYIQQHGGSVSLKTRAKQLVIEQNKVTGIICQDGSTFTADNIIIALSPSQSIDLLAEHIEMNKPSEYPICTVYLQYSPDTRLAKPMLGMSGTSSQWIFDRSEQAPGLMAVVISAPGEHEEMSNDVLIKHVCREVHSLFPELAETVSDSLVIREKRATFACTVGIEKQRPQSQTNIEGLWLAGDYVANSYPATLEGAIRNGENCAQSLLNQC
ncbi:MAG: NAD(P)-binding protein [Methylophaga sp.]|nr:NAD(P)-binding protein [Methylophaga sp.]